jgi:hypothetical protein
MLFLVTDSHWTTEIGIQQLVKKVLFIIADGIPADVIEGVYQLVTVNLHCFRNTKVLSFFFYRAFVTKI